MPIPIPTTQARIERLVREAPALVAELRLDAVLQRVADLAAEVVGARYVAVGLLAPDRRTLDTFIVSGLTEAERHAIGPLPTGRGVLGLPLPGGLPPPWAFRPIPRRCGRSWACRSPRRRE